MLSIFFPHKAVTVFVLMNKAILMARPNSGKGTLPLFYILLIPQIPPLTSDRPSAFAMLKMTHLKTWDFASRNSLGKKKEEKSKN